jgi:enoyl-CoA hydratase/carnithine racemase
VSRLEITVADQIGQIVLNRPEKLNALDAGMRRGLFTAFEALERDDGCRCILLAAEGRSFCVGADLTEVSDTGLQVPPRDFAPHLGENIEVSKPVIAAVQGHALGGGFLLAQMCDLVIAGESAQFAISEARRGRGAPWAAPLLARFGERTMMELLLTGRPFDARRAQATGLANAVVADAELRETARSWAAEIAANAPLSVRAAKAMVQRCSGLPGSAALDVADEIYLPVYESEDAREGPRAFAEKRDPVWRGR